MRLLGLKPEFFQAFEEVRTYFAVGKFKFELATREEVLWERTALLKELNLKGGELAFLNQIQSDKAFYFTSESKIDFLTEPTLSGDALYTDSPEIFLSVAAADCLPVLFYNKAVRVIGAVHAGWRGTQREILKKAIKLVQDKFDAPIGDFYFYFGPAAQVCCYDKEFVKDNLRQLQDLGITPRQIENSGICTIHNVEYPSHRREREARKGTILSIIGLRDENVVSPFMGSKADKSADYRLY